MLSNQFIHIVEHKTDETFTLLTWPAGASIPKVGERVVYYNKEQERRSVIVKEVEHEHLIKDHGTVEINVTLSAELE
jgi:hypothetical protein